jgi:tetratricopeptide (TPR) repeat protein
MKLRRSSYAYFRSKTSIARRLAETAVPAVVLAAFIAGLMSAAAVSAPRAQAPTLTEQNKRRNLSSSLRSIRPMMRDDPQRAIQMLHNLEREYPYNTQVLNLLGETFHVNGQIDSAIAVYKRCHTARPNDIRSGAALGTLFIKNDQRQMGEAVFTDLITRTKGSINTYRTIGSALSRNRFYDQALAMFEEGRRVNNDNYILTLDIAHLLRSMGDLSGALDEYVHLINTSPKHYKLARDRILELLRDPRAETDPLLEQLAQTAAAESPYRRSALETLALAYLERGMIENALDAALTAEAIGPSDGKVLFTLADKTVAEYRRRPYNEKGRYFDMALGCLE